MKNIPNAITISNLLLGCVSIYFSTKGLLFEAGLCIVFGAVADFFDGMVARLLGVSSPIGEQLDSLADLVSFGVAPGFIAFSILESQSYVSLVCLIIPACAAIRLARFNVQEKQQNFIGMPSPACGLFWAAMALAPASALTAIDNVYIWHALIITTALLMVIPLEMLSFKFKNLGWKGNEPRFVFLLLVVVSILVFRWLSAPIILVLYLLCSWLAKSLTSKHHEI